MIVVLDTNIVASATYWRGNPAHCLEALVLGKYDLAISHPILKEYEEVITLKEAVEPQITRMKRISVDSEGKGERDRPGRCHRRPADGSLRLDGEPNCESNCVAPLVSETLTSASGTHALPKFNCIG